MSSFAPTSGDSASSDNYAAFDADGAEFFQGKKTLFCGVYSLGEYMCRCFGRLDPPSRGTLTVFFLGGNADGAEFFKGKKTLFCGVYSLAYRRIHVPVFWLIHLRGTGTYGVFFGGNVNGAEFFKGKKIYYTCAVFWPAENLILPRGTLTLSFFCFV